MTDVLHALAFEDNYIWLIRGKSPSHVAIVDPGDADPVLAMLGKQHLKPVAILCTHYHDDHVGGVKELLRHFSIPVYGPVRERIAGLTHQVGEGDHVGLADLDVELSVLDVPGHTAGHVAYVGDGMLFCGDTLFSAGCGRLLGGTAEQMHASLSRLAALPENTRVYGAHEYTLANLRFALTIEPDNGDILAYRERAQSLRQQNLPTLPSTIGLERRVNPFLRTAQPGVRQAAEKQAGRTLASETEVFAVLRRWKDGFRG